MLTIPVNFTNWIEFVYLEVQSSLDNIEPQRFVASLRYVINAG